MDETVKKCIELSRNDSSVEKFRKVLHWCIANKERLYSYKTGECGYVALDKNVQICEETFEEIHRLNNNGTFVSPILATENINYVLVETQGEDFLFGHLIDFTVAVLSLREAYDYVNLKAVEINEGQISWVIEFYGLTCQ